jgi:hypothetical protein
MGASSSERVSRVPMSHMTARDRRRDCHRSDPWLHVCGYRRGGLLSGEMLP